MEKKRALFSHKYSRKTMPMFFTFLFASILCLFCTNTAIVSKVLSGQLGTLIDYNNYLEWLQQTVLDLELDLQYQGKFEQKQTLISCDTTSKTEEDDEDEVDREFEETLILPENITTPESRVAWYARKLPEADFFRLDELALKFETRVSNFLSQGCSVKFFMTWFAPSNRFGKRISFAMESLFKTNPKACLTIVSRTMDTNRGFQTLKPLIDRGFRVLAVTPNVDFLIAKTPAEDWIKSIVNGTKDPGSVPINQNLSNLLRLSILYRFGGVYIDADFLILRDMSSLRNAIGAQSMDSKTKQWTRLNNAALIFDAESPIMLEFISEFASTFNGNRWGYNGPYMVSRVVERLKSSKSYKDFQVLPPKAFYPVDWNEIQRLLKKPENNSDFDWVENKIKWLKDGTTYGIHLWNARIRRSKIEEGSVLGRLILELCIVCEDIYD